MRVRSPSAVVRVLCALLVVGDLPPPSFYETCLAEADDLARFDCLRAALASPSGVCDEGWSCPDCI